MLTIIFWTMGRDRDRFRLVVNNGEVKGIEVMSRDNSNDVSWRPASNHNTQAETSKVLARALSLMVSAAADNTNIVSQVERNGRDETHIELGGLS